MNVLMFRPRAGLAAMAATAATLAGLLSGCSNAPSNNSGVSRPLFTESEYGVSSSPRVITHDGPVRKGGGSYKLGSPYKVAGRWYVPRDEPGYDRQGTGSWYGADFHGRKTANGEIFDKSALTAAHPTLPLPSYAYVTNLRNGRTVLVRVNDRGPYVAGRIIDLSHASARALGYDGQGHAPVRVRYAGRAPLDGDDRRERRFLAEGGAEGGRDVSFRPVASAEDAPFGAYPAPERERLSWQASPRSADDVPSRMWDGVPAGAPERSWSATDYRGRLSGRSGLGGPVPEPEAATADATNPKAD